jgi:pyruvate dehydrogenase E2 component (dihydrolipoamide acetyltransferase)
MPTEVVMPKLGLNMSEGLLVEWLKKEGDPVTRGESLFVVETDKVTTESPAQVSGVLGKILVSAGEIVPVRAVVAYILAEGDAPDGLVSQPDRTRVEKESINTGSTDVKVPVLAQGGEKVLASPVAKRMAKEYGLDLAAVKGSGPGGRITQEDVERAFQSQGQPQAAEVSVTSVPIEGVRAVIARRMADSLASTAQVTLHSELDVTELVDFRDRLRANAESNGAQIPGFNAIFIYFVAKALHEHPRLNAKQVGEAIQLLEQIHIGLAVDTPAGLMVVVVRQADQKTIPEIHLELQELVSRAQARKSRPEDLEGGTFTITNLGQFGVDGFTPIINPPEMAILGIGRIAEKLVIRGGKVMQRYMSTLSLTFDHRLVDGAPAGRFLQYIGSLIEGLAEEA